MSHLHPSLPPAPLLVIVLLLQPGCPTEELDDDDASPPSWESLPEAIATVFADEAEDFGAPGAAIAIRHGERRYAAGFGSTDPDGGVDVAPSTLFRVGSITKTLTAAALLQQVDAGLLSIDDAVADHIDLTLEGSHSFDDVTLHDLLAHTSGLYEMSPIAGGGEDERLAAFTAGTFQNSAYLMNPPGEFWNYSNSNFSLAGLVVEETAGLPYREALADRLFDDLGMNRTMFRGDEVLDDGDYAVAWGRGWTAADPGPLRIEPDAYDDAWLRPAGGAWSNVLDLATFGDFLIHGDDDVLAADLHGEFIRSQVETRSFLDYFDYGYGVMLWSESAGDDGWYRVATREHSGAIPGYAGYLITVPSADLVIATLASTDWAYFPRTFATIWEELLDAERQDLPDRQIDPDDFERYAGEYDDPMQIGAIHVSVGADGELDVSLPDMDAVGLSYTSDLTAHSRDNFGFTMRGVPIGVTFLPAADGDPGEVRWFRTRYFVGERVDGRSEARERRAPDPSRLRILQPIVGGPPLR